MQRKQIIFLYGPTASGKTSLAVEIAKDISGEIINSDSKQVYKEIPIITAQPTPEEKQNIEHHLYGFISVEENFSVMDWINRAVKKIDEVQERGNIPIIVGGTGMYIKYLIEGMPQIPDISELNKEKSRKLIEEKGSEFVHNLLDENMKNKLNPNDRQRVSRAYEVFLQTGKSLSYWQSMPNEDFINSNEVVKIYLCPDREALYNKAEKRFDQMLANGAMNEVSSLVTKNLQGRKTSMLAHGIPELLSYFDGKLSLDEASQIAKKNTRNYIKRQKTWFNNQIKSHLKIENLEEKSLVLNYLKKIK